jgi:hypothetical protein
MLLQNLLLAYGCVSHFDQELFTHTILDPIILSDDDSAGAESEADRIDLDIDARAQSLE